MPVSRSIATRASSATPPSFRQCTSPSSEPRCSRRFREGALIYYPCACIIVSILIIIIDLNFCTRSERNRRRSRIVAAPDCTLKLIVAAASIRSYTVFIYLCNLYYSALCWWEGKDHCNEAEVIVQGLKQGANTKKTPNRTVR